VNDSAATDGPQSGPARDDSAQDSLSGVGRAPVKPAPPEKKRGLLGTVRELAIIVVIALVVSALIRSFLMQLYVIPSASMENTLDIGDRGVVIRVADFHRGDVVVFKDPDNWLGNESTSTSTNPVRQVAEFLGVAPSASTDHLVKRVIGMPGDHVTCCSTSGRIEVNGQAIDETSYLYSVNGVQVNPSDVPFDVVVPADTIFVLGDHRNDSRDSRYHLCDAVSAGEQPGSGAFVPISDVVGPMVAIAMPVSRITRFTVPATFESVPDPGPAPAQATITRKPC
jgi:signal peptidase I